MSGLPAAGTGARGLLAAALLSAFGFPAFGHASAAVSGALPSATVTPLPPICDGIERARGTMGTIARVVVCEPRDEATAALAAGAALDAIDRVDDLMSLYKPGSELSRLNRDGGAGPVPIDPWLAGLLAAARDLTRETGGAFDITIKPLMDHYGFYAELGFPPPTGGLRGALRAVGSRNLIIDASDGTARFGRPGMGVDPGGIGKGFALDRAAEALRGRGVERAVIDLGRSYFFLGAGPAPGGLWPAAIVDPLETDRVGTCLRVPPGSLSTSSPSGRTMRTAAGEVGHVLDPGRGALVTDRLQVTVWSPSGTRADALSTAALVLSSRKLGRLLARSGEWALVSARSGGPAAGTSEPVEYAVGRSFVSPCDGW